MKISQATLEDVDWITEVTSVDMINLLGSPDLLDLEYMRSVFIPYVIDTGLAIIAKEGSTPIGCIGGIVTPAIYNPKKSILTELCWWVHEDYRAGSVGARLLSRFEASAKNMNTDYINMTILPSTQLNGKALERRGYIHKESSYMLEA